MIPSRRRLLLLPAASLLLAAACATPPTGIPAPSDTPPTVPVPSSLAPPTSSPAAPTLPPTGSQPPTGNTDERFPEVAVSSGGPGAIIELTDPGARTWRIVVSGTDGGDRLELLVEAGDIVPGVVVSTFVDGSLVDEHDLTRMVDDPTAAAGGCHPVLQACYSSGGILVDLDAGRIGLVVEQVAPTPLRIVGMSAAWRDEPFIPGPWRSTEPVVIGIGG